jgi:cellulose synthase/poly-beta-1,6-N-acetylglucosamine synthase-like glycosyltransferase
MLRPINGDVVKCRGMAAGAPRAGEVAFSNVGGAVFRRADPKYAFGSSRVDATRPEKWRILRRPGQIRCAETDCLRRLLPHDMIDAAEVRARAIGVGAERVLICAHAITEEGYLKALANWLGTTYEPLDEIARKDCPLDDNQLIQAVAAGLLPLRRNGGITWIIAPRGLTARRLADRDVPRPQWLRSFGLTSPERLRQFAERHARRAIGERATDTLRLAHPLLSNAPSARSAGVTTTVSAVCLLFLFSLLAPLMAIEALSVLLCVLFLTAAALRLLSAFFDHAKARAMPIDAAQLPVYTIICALYKEGPVVKNLVAAIRALDYPPEKLDVKIVIEPDDEETRDALTRLNLGAPFQIIVAPAAGPRTKPKALNVALPFARGLYTVVYDAEDLPEPDQLRRALDVFRKADSRLACVQASLTIDNTSDNWLARMFTANYAGQFDAFLPGLAALHLPFLLGGSSNHFRTTVLRQAGGWDPYNVTEDADLGIRLYRLGYRCAALSSATYEEAPAHFTAWLKQRTRWYKGWMQTWLVHMRRPRRLWRDLGPAGMIAFQIFLAANVLAALIHPLFMTGLIYALIALPSSFSKPGIDNVALIFTTSLLSGYGSTILLDVVGLKRRRLLRQIWVLALTPLHWLLLSLAAWRALFQLATAPQRWEKTEHGLAKTSRLASAQPASPWPDVPPPLTGRTAYAPLTARSASPASFPPLYGRSATPQDNFSYAVDTGRGVPRPVATRRYRPRTAAANTAIGASKLS